MESMISKNFIQEQLSLAYVKAVVFRSGFNMSEPAVDCYGIDGTIVDPPRNGVNRVDFQLKSTTQHTVRENEIAYDLRVKNYNRLVYEGGLPCVLILFVMPRDEAQWICHSEEKLCLRKCAYWVSLEGKPRSDHSSSVRVCAPRSQTFDPDGMRDMFDRLLINGG